MPDFDSWFCSDSERTRGALQDSAAAEQKAKAGAQPEKLHRVLELENLESLQLFNKYVHIPSVFAVFQKSCLFLFRFLLTALSYPLVSDADLSGYLLNIDISMVLYLTD